MKIVKAAIDYTEGRMSFDALLKLVASTPFESRTPTTNPWVPDDDPDGTLSEVSDAAIIAGLTPAETRQLMAAVKRPGGSSSDFSADVEVVKSHAPKHRVFGWANTSLSEDGTLLVDRQGHMIPLDDLEEGAYKFTAKRYGSGDMHTSDGFGTLIESAVVTQDKVDAGVFPRQHLGKWWVGFQLPPEEWEKVNSGKRRAFSIQGKGKLTPVE